MRQSKSNTQNSFRLPLVAAMSFLLATGCAGFRETTCAEFKAIQKEMDYSTQYRLQASDTEYAPRQFKPLPKGAAVVVRQYTLQIDPPEMKACNHLQINKEIFIQRKNDRKLVLEEIREFYTAKGELIASKSELVSNQMRASGFYTGSTPLPIPEKAPPGKYRIVSKLVMKTNDPARPEVLARASASFKVLARN